MRRWTAQMIELAVARHYGYRHSLIVPNVSWGWGIAYEADLVILRSSGWAWEIEIKVSPYDITRDRSKRHTHACRLFQQMYFAVPEALAGHPDIPEYAGILSVNDKLMVTLARVAKRNPGAVKIDASKRTKLAELGAMRVWSLKDTLMRKMMVEATR